MKRRNFINLGKQFKEKFEKENMSLYNYALSKEFNANTAKMNNGQKTKFVRGVLTGSSNKKLFGEILGGYGLPSSPELNSEILEHLIKATRNNPSPWVYEFIIDNLIENDRKLRSFDILESHVEYLVALCLLDEWDEEEDDLNDGWFSAFYLNSDVFSNHKSKIKEEIIKQAGTLKPNTFTQATVTFNDVSFLKDLLDSIFNNNSSLFDKAIEYILEILVHKDEAGDILSHIINNYSVQIMKNTHNVMSLIKLSSFLDEHNTEDNTLLVDILNNSKITYDELNTKAESTFNGRTYFDFLKQNNSIEVRTFLYELTGNADYLPQEVRDIFIF